MATETEQIFEKLAAPFLPEELKTRRQDGREMHYITARTARRRLNEVLGPQHWECRIEPAEHWVKCVLTITLPDGQTVTREALGGYPKMPSEEDKVKGGDSDAFKRCCVTFGIAEYLYGDDHVALERTEEARPRPPTTARATPPRDGLGRPPAPERGARSYDDYALPPHGRALYAWCRKHEDLCGFPEGKIIKIVDAHFGPDSEYGPEMPRRYVDWSESHVRNAALFVMDYLSRRPEYEGKFDKYLGHGRDRAAAPAGAEDDIPF